MPTPYQQTVTANSHVLSAKGISRKQFLKKLKDPQLSEVDKFLGTFNAKASFESQQDALNNNMRNLLGVKGQAGILKDLYIAEANKRAKALWFVRAFTSSVALTREVFPDHAGLRKAFMTGVAVPGSDEKEDAASQKQQAQERIWQLLYTIQLNPLHEDYENDCRNLILFMLREKSTRQMFFADYAYQLLGNPVVVGVPVNVNLADSFSADLFKALQHQFILHLISPNRDSVFAWAKKDKNRDFITDDYRQQMNELCGQEPRVFFETIINATTSDAELMEALHYFMRDETLRAHFLVSGLLGEALRSPGLDNTEATSRLSRLLFRPPNDLIRKQAWWSKYQQHFYDHLDYSPDNILQFLANACGINVMDQNIRGIPQAQREEQLKDKKHKLQEAINFLMEGGKRREEFLRSGLPGLALHSTIEDEADILILLKQVLYPRAPDKYGHNKKRDALYNEGLLITTMGATTSISAIATLHRLNGRQVTRLNADKAKHKADIASTAKIAKDKGWRWWWAVYQPQNATPDAVTAGKNYETAKSNYEAISKALQWCLNWIKQWLSTKVTLTVRKVDNSGVVPSDTVTATKEKHLTAAIAKPQAYDSGLVFAPDAKQQATIEKSRTALIRKVALTTSAQKIFTIDLLLQLFAGIITFQENTCNFQLAKLIFANPIHQQRKDIAKYPSVRFACRIGVVVNQADKTRIYQDLLNETTKFQERCYYNKSFVQLLVAAIPDAPLADVMQGLDARLLGHKNFKTAVSDKLNSCSLTTLLEVANKSNDVAKQWFMTLDIYKQALLEAAQLLTANEVSHSVRDNAWLGNVLDELIQQKQIAGVGNQAVGVRLDALDEKGMPSPQVDPLDKMITDATDYTFSEWMALVKAHPELKQKTRCIDKLVEFIQDAKITYADLASYKKQDMQCYTWHWRLQYAFVVRAGDTDTSRAGSYINDGVTRVALWEFIEAVNKLYAIEIPADQKPAVAETVEKLLRKKAAIDPYHELINQVLSIKSPWLLQSPAFQEALRLQAMNTDLKYLIDDGNKWKILGENAIYQQTVIAKIKTLTAADVLQQLEQPGNQGSFVIWLKENAEVKAYIAATPPAMAANDDLPPPLVYPSQTRSWAQVASSSGVKGVDPTAGSQPNAAPASLTTQTGGCVISPRPKRRGPPKDLRDVAREENAALRHH